MAESQTGGQVATCCTGSFTPSHTKDAAGPRVHDCDAQTAWRSVVRRLWRRLGSCGEPLVPGDHRGSRRAAGCDLSALGCSQDAELRGVLRCASDRWENRSSVLVRRVAPIAGRRWRAGGFSLLPFRRRDRHARARLTTACRQQPNRSKSSWLRRSRSRTSIGSGACRDRTGDLRLAKPALSQLS
jgi:hypothetical protein